MDRGLVETIERALSGRVAAARSVAGGDINQAYRVELADGRVAFVKTNEHASPEMFPAEARGLGFLAEAHALRVPKVLAVLKGAPGAPGFLALEFMKSEPRCPDFDARLGRGLARLHAKTESAFGLDHDNFIGSLPQSNATVSSWAEFYRARRLEPQLRRAADAGLVDAKLVRAFDALLGKLESVVGQPEPPARLHGDLWGGNLLVDDAGAPCLIDPAVYAGHREVDLAMMRLFGGFSERVFAAYDEALPLSPGHDERVALYQLYPLLVHVNLFGGGYVGSVERALGRYV